MWLSRHHRMRRASGPDACWKSLVDAKQVAPRSASCGAESPSHSSSKRPPCVLRGSGSRNKRIGAPSSSRSQAVVRKRGAAMMRRPDRTTRSQSIVCDKRDGRAEPIDVRPFALPCRGLAHERCTDCRLRRIWQVDRETLGVLLGVLASREVLESLISLTGRGEPLHTREDVLLSQVLDRCAEPCSLAAALETFLDQRTLYGRRRWVAWPMAALAEWWEENRPSAPAVDLAAFLWSIATDTRSELAPLLPRVVPGIRLRAMREFSNPGQLTPVAEKAPTECPVEAAAARFRR